MGAVVAAALVAGAAGAQTDPSGAWRTWTTDHFRIHAPPALESQVHRLAAEAERSWALLGTELVPPRGRIDLALMDNVDYANGFTSTFPSNRILIYLPAPGTDPSLGNYDEWLRLVTIHELVHAFQLDRARGLWGALRAVFGRNPGLFPNVYQPSWVTEGLATYYESRFSSAGRVRGGFHTQLLTALAPSSEWPGPGDATFASPVWPAGQRPYAWGSRFFADQVARHGDSLVGPFVERSAAQVWVFGTSRPLRLAGGDSVAAGWRALRERLRPATPGPVGTVVVRGLRQEPHPRVAPGGRRIAFVHDDGTTSPTVVQRSVGGNTVFAAHGITGDADLVWAGGALWVTQLDFVSPVEVRGDLYVWGPDDSWQRLTHGSRVSAPFDLRDGRVGVVQLGAGARELGAADREGRIERLPAPPADDWGRVAVSPDGRTVVAARHAGGRWDIVTWPRDDPGALRRITDDAALDAAPVWSDDGATVAFVSEREGPPQILRFDVVTGTVERLTAEPAGAREPAFLPDGSLLYQTVLPDGYAIVWCDGRALGGGPETAPAAAVALAPAVAVRGGNRYDPWPALLPRYWMPVAHDEGTAGLFLGVLTGGEDVIGRTSYGLRASVAPENGRWEASAGVVHQRWRRLALDLSAAQTWDDAGRYVTGGGDTVSVGERQRVVRGGASLRWRRWRTALSLRAGGEVEQDADFSEDPTGPRFRNPTFAGVVVSATASHAHRPALAISPEDGVAVSTLLRRRWQLDGDGWSGEWRGAASGYLGLPVRTFTRAVLAATVRSGITWGPSAGGFEIGGTSSEPLAIAPGLTAGGRRSFPLRGYPPNDERFPYATVEIVELRVPLWLVGRSWLAFPLGLDRISLAAFVEAGGGWSEGEAARPFAYRDVGGELMVDVIAGFDVVVRVRGGVAVPLADGLGVSRGATRAYIGLGTEF